MFFYINKSLSLSLKFIFVMRKNFHIASRLTVIHKAGIIFDYLKRMNIERNMSTIINHKNKT